MSANDIITRAIRALYKCEKRMEFVEAEAKWSTDRSRSPTPRWREALWKISRELGAISVLNATTPDNSHHRIIKLARRTLIKIKWITHDTSNWLHDLQQFGISKTDSAELDRKLNRTVTKLERAIQDIVGFYANE